jgi:hypothetical protein
MKCPAYFHFDFGYGRDRKIIYEAKAYTAYPVVLL